MQDLARQNGSLQATFCGSDFESSGEGGTGGNLRNMSADSSLAGAPVGFLAAACGLTNVTLGSVDPMETYMNLTRMWNNYLDAADNSSKGNNEPKPKPCNELNYNTTNRHGEEALNYS